MKGLFIPGITAEMFRSGCLESIENLMSEGEIFDIDYDPRHIPAIRDKLWEIQQCSNCILKPEKKIAEIKPQWTPVTEGLPEEGEEGSDEVSVTCDNGRKHYFVTTGILLKGDWVNVVDNYYLPCEVVAWMPLPEPYRPEVGK